MTFLTIEQINSNPNHAPIDDETNFINRIKTEIFKIVSGLSVHRKINAKTVPNEFYRKVILKMTFKVVEAWDNVEQFPRYDTTYDEETGGVDSGYGCDWNEKPRGRGAAICVREWLKEQLAEVAKEKPSSLVGDVWHEAITNAVFKYDEPCPIIGYNSDSKSEVRFYKKKGWLK